MIDIVEACKLATPDTEVKFLGANGITYPAIVVSGGADMVVRFPDGTSGCYIEKITAVKTADGWKRVKHWSWRRDCKSDVERWARESFSTALYFQHDLIVLGHYILIALAVEQINPQASSSIQIAYKSPEAGVVQLSFTKSGHDFVWTFHCEHGPNPWIAENVIEMVPPPVTASV